MSAPARELTTEPIRATKVVSSVAYNYLNTFYVTITGFLFTAFIVHHVSHSRYGVWVLTGSVITYSALFDFGIGLTVMKMVAERTHLKSRSEVVELISNALVMYSILGLIVTGAAFCAEPFLGVLFHVHGETLHIFRISLAISAACLGITFPSAIYTAINQAFQDYRYVSVLGIVVQSFGVGLSVVALLLGYGIIGVVVTGTVMNIVNFAAKIVHVRRKFGITPRFALRRWPVARQIFSMSVWVFLLNVAAQMIFETDNIVVGAVLGTAAVASYQVALGPASGLQTLGDQFHSVSLTAAASFKAHSAEEDMRRLLIEATRMIGVIVMPGVVIFSLWGRQLLDLWVGHSFSSSYPTLVVLSFALLVAALQGTAAQVILALDRYKVTAAVALGEAVTNLVLSVVFAHIFGIIGVAIGTAIPIALTTFFVYIPFACRLVGISLGHVARRLALPAVVNLAVFGVLRLFADGPRLFPHLIVLLVAGGLVFIATVGASLLLDSEQRPTYFAMLRRLRGITGAGR